MRSPRLRVPCARPSANGSIRALLPAACTNSYTSRAESRSPSTDGVGAEASLVAQPHAASVRTEPAAVTPRDEPPRRAPRSESLAHSSKTRARARLSRPWQAGSNRLGARFDEHLGCAPCIAKSSARRAQGPRLCPLVELTVSVRAGAALAENISLLAWVDLAVRFIRPLRFVTPGWHELAPFRRRLLDNEPRRSSA